MNSAVAPSLSAVGQDLDQLCVNAIRTLSMDAVQAANSGHPGTPMAMAPVAYCLWQQFLRFDPQDAVWPNRDRFVLSIGHASTLLYALLHLTEVRAVSKDYETLGEPSVPLDALKAFRQLDSRCPGHPEYRWTSGVEATTGPRGQGVATTVGMAIARQWLAARYNRPGFELFDFNVYAVCGDGCMMEGISGEAASLAGHLRLANLRWLYDIHQIGGQEKRMHDGGNLRRGRIARRTSAACQSLLDLRQQPHHHRRQYRSGFHGGCSHPLHRLRVERNSGGRCERSRNACPSVPNVSKHQIGRAASR